APQMGWEGANVIFDSWVHPLMMGLEEHLIGMFRHDFEFVDGHRSHLGDGAPSLAPVADAVHEAPMTTSVGQGTGGVALAEAPARTAVASSAVASATPSGAAQAAAAATATTAATATASAPGASGEPAWTADGEAELHKIPFFVRGKVKRNTETFARERGIAAITAETLYDAKAHYSR
ncbi:MAG: hypothetical protein VKI42_03450, partial [Synechococcaceae cyanobacterium]|nr:hypothetical protein [Synechococcaceae cyanobacterium]